MLRSAWRGACFCLRHALRCIEMAHEWPFDLEEREGTEGTEGTEDTCYFFCPMCMKEHVLETKAGDGWEVVCDCGNLIFFGRTKDKSGLVMWLLF